jgi:hypothetical protein
MASLMRNFLMGFFLLAFLSVCPQRGVAQDKDMDMDGKIKRLEALEARVDAKIRKLEEMEARLEAKIQPVDARTEGVAESSENGMKGRHGTVSASAASGAAATRGNDLERRVKQLEEESIHQVMFRGGYTHLNSPAQSAVFTGPKNDTDGWNAGAVIGVKLLRDPFLDNPVMGEVSLDFSRISGNTKFALGKSGNQSLFRVAVTPKYRFDNLGDFSPALSRIRPWLTPSDSRSS